MCEADLGGNIEDIGGVTSYPFTLTGTGFVPGDTVTTGITAAGANQAGATQLTTEMNQVSTVAAGTGVALPSATIGGHCVIRNDGANPLLVYPKNGDGAAINAEATDASITIQTDTTAYFESTSATHWYSIP
jgi:hypothetical protein